MRGKIPSQTGFISLLNVEDLIEAKHPIRAIKKMMDGLLREMSPLFDDMYAELGRPSVPPERLLKAKVLQALFTIRSDRQICERLKTDLLFRWFLDLSGEEEVFDASTFSHNQARLLEHAVSEVFFHEVVEMARRGGWVSDEHFSVDGTLIEAWASMKSFRPKDEKPSGNSGEPGEGRNRWADFRGQKRSNQTHASTTDPEAKLMRKGPGQEAKLVFGAHAVMENRNGLCVTFEVREAVGEPESRVASEQMEDLPERAFSPQTVGADKGYHTKEFVDRMRDLQVDPHVALHAARDKMNVVVTTAYEVSQKTRKRIEEVFGWIKTTGGFRRTRYRGVERTHAAGQIVVATLNLLRIAKLATAE